MIEEIRRSNLRELVKELGSVTAVAHRLGHSNSTQLSQWLNASPDSKTGKPRSMSSSSARKIESSCGKPPGWMDIDHAHPEESGHLRLTLTKAQLDTLRWAAEANGTTVKNYLFTAVAEKLSVSKSPERPEHSAAIQREYSFPEGLAKSGVAEGNSRYEWQGSELPAKFQQVIDKFAGAASSGQLTDSGIDLIDRMIDNLVSRPAESKIPVKSATRATRKISNPTEKEISK